MDASLECAPEQDRLSVASAGSDFRENRASETTNEYEVEEAVKFSKQLLRLFQNSSFHVVLLANCRSNLCTCVTSITTPPPHPLDVPPEAKAVVVGCFLGHEMQSMKLVRLVAEKHQHFQVLVFLMTLPDDPRDNSGVEDVRTTFKRYGATDVFIVKSASHAKACLRGFLLGLDESVNTNRKGNWIIAHETRDRHQAFEQHADSITWENIHKSVRGLPPLDPDVDPQMRCGETIADGVLVQRLGRGACGEVYLWRQLDGQTEAFKFVSKGNAPRAEKILSICREVKLLSRLRHPQVAYLRRVIHAQRHVIISTNYAGDMSLFKYLQCAAFHSRRSPESRSSLFAPINDGVGYCHEQGVAHRDLKPENIVVRHSSDAYGVPLTLTVVDFGSACRIGRSRSDLAGTMPFIAPDVLLEVPYCPAQADMWSCGVIFLEIAYGIGKLIKMLKADQNVEPSRKFGRHLVKFFNALHDRVRHQGPSDASMPVTLSDVLLGLLTPSPERRWTAEDVEASDWYASATFSRKTAWTDVQDEHVDAPSAGEDVKVESFDSEPF
eukprot:TRINITY_DN4843_c0_g2_i1.p1 TRINITY_DN4843_c0_g2~~TRINITY_DN4843_c0_g2_i1.p1  ORF type:complete len:561 (+),score=77.98 TRINITY_DN4843_c0_g2_i1:30-1685(+)